MQSGPSATVAVRVQPRSRKDEFVEVRDGVLVVRVQAPPVDGRANAAVRRLIADRLGVRTASVVVVRGERARDKLIRVDGVTQIAAEAELGLKR
jgi:hypothetical protein